MSALTSELARGLTDGSGANLLPGSMALIVLATLLLLLVTGEASRGLLSHVEQRANATVVVVGPLVFCAALAVGARIMGLIT